MSLLVNNKLGFTLVETLLVLAVSLSMMGLKFKELRSELLADQAKIAGEQIKSVGNAVNGYIVANYADLIQLKSNSSRVCSGQVCTITSQTLIDSGLLPATFTGKNVFGSDYSIQLRRAGSAPTYTINGLIITNKPWADGKQINHDLLGLAMRAAGADSGVSKNNTQISGYSGVWTEKQSDFSSITKAGQLAYRAGFDSGMYTVYLRRDGTLPMTGDLNLDGHNINNIKDVNASGAVNAGSVKSAGRIEGSTIHSAGFISAGGAVDAGGELSARNGYGDVISLGGDAYGNDYEIRLGSPKTLTVFSPNGRYTTTMQVRRNVKIDERLGLMGTDPNVLPAGWGGGLTTTDVYANGTVGLGSGGGLSAYINSSGNVFASNNITGGSVTSNGRLTAGEFVQVNGVANEGSGCSPNGLIGRDSTGAMLSCQSGAWRKSSGIGKAHIFRDSGILGNFTYCSLIDVAPTANIANQAACSIYLSKNGVWSLNSRSSRCAAACF